MKQREIKFRAWDKSLKLYKYPSLWDNSMPSNWQHWYILQQFTGMKDQDGKEIYEGDIIKKRFGSSMPIFSVAWDCNRAMFIQADGYNSPLCDINPNYLEVIGNIYENPELLTPSGHD